MPSHIDLKHLQMIDTIARCETVKKAAETLCISQPALSSRIKEAERRLNCKLFVRRGRKLALSRAGERLLQSASLIIDELDRAVYDIQRHSEGIEQVLRIGFPRFSSFTWMPEGIREFALTYPHIELEVSALEATNPLQSLSRGEVDAVVMASKGSTQPDISNTCAVTTLFRDEMVALLPEKHPLAEQAFVSAGELQLETYITTSTLPERDREYELLFKPEGAVPYKVIQVGFIDAIFELVQAGMGVSIMNRWVLESLGQRFSVKALPITTEGLHIDWHCVYLDDASIADPALYLCRHLRRQSA